MQVNKKTAGGVFGILTITFFFVLIPHTDAQMMGNMVQPQPSISLSGEDKQDIQTGQNLFMQFQSQKLNCQNLNSDDFEKIGEYVMNNQMGETKHAQMNAMIVQMMGADGEAQMHIIIGERATNCQNTQTTNTNQINPSNQRNNTPMNWGHPYMMRPGNGSNNEFRILFFIFSMISFVDLILAGVWLWKQINKKHTK